MDPLPKTKVPVSPETIPLGGDNASFTNSLSGDKIDQVGGVSKTTWTPFDLSSVETPSSFLPSHQAIPAAIESAEGYLELVTRPASRLGVSSSFRRRFAKRSLRLAIDCGSCADNPKFEARRQMVIGQSRRLLRRYEKATTAFRRAAKHRPTRIDALMAIGWCQKRLGNFEQSIVALTRALAIAPEDPRLHYNLACYLCCLGDFRAAIYELAWAIELKPALRNRALAEPDLTLLRNFPAFAALTRA